MVGFAVAVLLSITALISAPWAGADPEILVPECSEGQVAQPGECTPQPVFGPGAELLRTPGAFPGANPGLPLGPTPRNFPVVIGLGVTPFNVPSNLPLGPTPPGALPFPS